MKKLGLHRALSQYTLSVWNLLRKLWYICIKFLIEYCYQEKKYFY